MCWALGRHPGIGREEARRKAHEHNRSKGNPGPNGLLFRHSPGGSFGVESEKMNRKVLKNDIEAEDSQALRPLEPEGLLCRISELVEEYAQKALLETDHDKCVEYLMAARILLKLLRPFGEVRIKVKFSRKQDINVAAG